MDNTSWMEKEKLEKYGFAKYLVRIDEREAARAGLYARPLTQANVEKHLIDFGLDAEFGTTTASRASPAARRSSSSSPPPCGSSPTSS